MLTVGENRLFFYSLIYEFMSIQAVRVSRRKQMQISNRKEIETNCF